MEYKLNKIDEENQAILISVDGFGIWIDYREDEEGFFEWNFNKYIFYEWIESDVKTRELQNKIYKDIDNFTYFLDEILSDLEMAIELTKKESVKDEI